MAHVNLYFAWGLMLAGMLAGAVIGLSFHKQDWLGGYAAWPRRMVRLGHIAFFGTGMLNLGFALSLPHIDPTGDGGLLLTATSILLIVGAATMPTVCFACAWRKPLRNLFFIPAASLIGAVTALLLRGILL